MQYLAKTVTPTNGNPDREDLTTDVLVNLALLNSGAGSIQVDYRSVQYGSGVRTLAPGAPLLIRGLWLRFLVLTGASTVDIDASYPEEVEPLYLAKETGNLATIATLLGKLQFTASGYLEVFVEGSP